MHGWFKWLDGIYSVGEGKEEDERYETFYGTTFYLHLAMEWDRIG